MKLETKANANDTVWFFLLTEDKVKFYEGTVQRILSWDDSLGFRYLIDHINPNGELRTYDVQEKDVYKSKSEVTNNAFEVNGTLKEQPAPTSAD